MTPETDPVLARAVHELQEEPDAPGWFDISSSILSRVRATTRRTWPVDASFPTSPAGRDGDSLRISDLAVRTAILRALSGVRGSQPTDIALYLDDHVCTGLSIAVVGAYGSDLQVVGDDVARIAADVVREVLGVELARTEIDVRVDDIEV